MDFLEEVSEHLETSICLETEKARDRERETYRILSLEVYARYSPDLSSQSSPGC